MIQKSVNAKVKVGLNSSIIVWNLDIYCPRSHHLSNSFSTTSKMLIQEITAKKSRPIKSKPKKTKSVDEKAPVLFYTNAVEFLE